MRQKHTEISKKKEIKIVLIDRSVFIAAPTGKSITVVAKVCTTRALN